VIWASLAIVLVAMTLLSFAYNPVMLCACLLVWGVFGWTFTPSQTNRLLDTFPENGPLLITLNGSAVQLGVTAGGLTGAGVHSILGATALAPTAAAIIAAALVLYATTHRPRDQRDHAAVDEQITSDAEA
jgi:predicted MFS family arabinose efflux permease